MKNISFPLVCSNLDLTDVPEMAKFVKKSLIIERNGRKIGIIGYILPETIVSL